MRFQTKNGVLIAQANGETLRIEPWGKDSLRVRATMLPGFSGKDWALTEVWEGFFLWKKRKHGRWVRAAGSAG